MSTHYTLLGVPSTAAPEEIKRAFRREVTRYHPDKVQHLGPEFQEIAANRSAALTEAYRVLMDPEMRRWYDGQLTDPGAGAQTLSPGSSQTPRTGAVADGFSPASSRAPRTDAAAQGFNPASSRAPRTDDAAQSFNPASPQAPRTGAVAQGFSPASPPGISEFVKGAVLGKVHAAVGALHGTTGTAAGFDAVYQITGRQGIFRKSEPGVRLAVKVVSQVDAASLQEMWPAAVRIPAAGDPLCLMLLGSGLAPARELAQSITDLRKKTRRPAPLVIPVDFRDWAALVPPETPPPARSVLDRLRQRD